MINLQILCKVLSDQGINASFDSPNEICINRTTIIVRGQMANFGRIKLRISDVYSFLTVIENEGLVGFPHGLKVQIDTLYRVEVYKSYEVTK